MSRFHQLVALPPGKTIGDINPAFSEVKVEVRVGPPIMACAACRKPFTIARKVRARVRLYPAVSAFPIVWQHPICGACICQCRRGGDALDAVLAAVEAFHVGEVANQ